MVKYQLMNKDKVVLEFIKTDTLEGQFKIIKEYKNETRPYLIAKNSNELDTWVNSRAIPTSREHIDRVLLSLNLDSKERFNLLLVNHGTSLNDTYWIREENELNINGSLLRWNDVNLYKGFKENLGLISFFGNTSSLGGKIRTPELTTQGMLRKAWRIIEGDIYLYKANTYGYANAGNEMYSEIIAFQVAAVLGLDYVKYEMVKWNEIECVRSKLFTSENFGYLTMTEYLTSELGSKTKWRYNDVCRVIPDRCIDQLNDLMVFDFIIENKDRHFSNFGFLINNDTGEIKGLAPIFDNGYSLLNFEMEQDFKEYDYSKSMIGTFDIDNKAQAKEIIKQDPKKYKNWANILANHIEKIDFSKVPEYRARAMVNLLKSRCKMIQEF
ncbi:MAG: HipA domain-containing protein [Clostridium sp.]|uniref:HipA domain-containing protein n=1 Tax=Clostridium sp. TaxID=1506 RepID=UPI0025C41332|nr:HipA domain-containing protein [Clostridium sp.]MCE5219681.1 HipA domain-containing protein [Clostridium sp.]